MRQLTVILSVLTAAIFETHAGSLDWLFDTASNDDTARKQAEFFVWDGVSHAVSASFEKVNLVEKDGPFYLFHVVITSPRTGGKRDRSSYLVCFKLTEDRTDFLRRRSSPSIGTATKLSSRSSRSLTTSASSHCYPTTPVVGTRAFARVKDTTLLRIPKAEFQKVLTQRNTLKDLLSQERTAAGPSERDPHDEVGPDMGALQVRQRLHQYRHPLRAGDALPDAVHFSFA
jgi:hypothetical protein